MAKSILHYWHYATYAHFSLQHCAAVFPLSLSTYLVSHFLYAKPDYYQLITGTRIKSNGAINMRV